MRRFVDERAVADDGAMTPAELEDALVPPNRHLRSLPALAGYLPTAASCSVSSAPAVGLHTLQDLYPAAVASLMDRNG